MCLFMFMFPFRRQTKYQYMITNAYHQSSINKNFLIVLSFLLQAFLGLSSKESACNSGGTGLFLGQEGSPGGGHDNQLQCLCLETPWTEEPGGLWSMGSQSVRHD